MSGRFSSGAVEEGQHMKTITVLALILFFLVSEASAIRIKRPAPANGNVTLSGPISNYASNSSFQIRNVMVNAEGRVKEENRASISSDHKYTYIYNAAGWITQITDPLNKVTHVVYSGTTLTVTDAENHTTSHEYNDLPGLITKITDAQGKIADYTYDAAGRLTTVVFNGARTQSCQYDYLDNITSETHPETGTISYTYNEPTIFFEYALTTMKLAHQNGLKNVWVSNGFMSEETLRKIIPYLDAINVDIKSFDPLFYKTNCGGKLEPVLENCKRLVREGVWLEITTLVIPTLSDDEYMLRNLGQYIKNDLGDFVPWHISAFSGAISWKLNHIPDTDPEIIKRIYQIGKNVGLKYVYAGNVWEKELEGTYCFHCGELVIDRIGYEIKRYDTKGKCPKCGEKVEGFFN